MGLDPAALAVIAAIVFGVKAIADGFVSVVELVERFRFRRLI